MSSIAPLHESTAVTKQQRHKKSDESSDNDDPALQHVWWWEETPGPNAGPNAVLTEAALDRIEAHRYKAGAYTWLDNIMNPVWTWLTNNLLPASMAPNLVTAVGALHCAAVYTTVWYYSYNHNPDSDDTDGVMIVKPAPAAVLLMNSYCLAVAYTLDCMDGKQARRLQASSPLGQLLDHGLDSLCLLAHVAANQAFLCVQDTLVLQLVLQTAFYLAQWEEYYTGILPHATGPIGVTEVNYGMALSSLLHGLWWSNALSRQEFYTTPVMDDVQSLLQGGWLSRRLVDVSVSSVAFLFSGADENINESSTSTVDQLAVWLEGWERRHAVLAVWSSAMIFLCSLSVGRVWRHLGSNNHSNGDSYKHRWTAFWHLASPLALSILTGWPEFSNLMTTTTSIDEGSIASMIQQTLRWKSLAIGILYSHITIKVIVYSMARQAVAVVQWDVLPAALAVLWTHTDPRLTVAGHALVWQVLTAVWTYRMVSWNVAATRQICTRLNIPVWTLPPKTATTDDKKKN